MNSTTNLRASTSTNDRATALKRRWRVFAQNRIGDSQFLSLSMRFAIGRSLRAAAFAVHRVVRRFAPALACELAVDALQPRGGERPSARSIDALLVHAIGTDTRLRFFREDVIVFAGERCSLETTRVLRAARLALASRIEDLFGVEVSGAPRDVAERAALADARTARPIEIESDRDWSPPADVVLAPWELEAESIPPARARRTPSSPRAPLASHSPRLSRLSEVGAPPPCAHAGPADRSAASRVSGCAPDRSLASVPATDATDLPQLQTSCGRGVSQEANRPEGAEVEPHASAQPH